MKSSNKSFDLIKEGYGYLKLVKYSQDLVPGLEQASESNSTQHTDLISLCNDTHFKNGINYTEGTSYFNHYY